MSLIKANGNMYPWVTHMHSHLRGACPHACPYCYATKGRAQRFAQGPLTFKADELNVGYGSKDGVPKTIFIEHTHDLFAMGVADSWIDDILTHCRRTPENTYVFQSRNLGRLYDWHGHMPDKCIVGTTIETDEFAPGCAPDPVKRGCWMGVINDHEEWDTFVTIEPIIDFDLARMIRLMEAANPDWINIGADSKGCGLKEPSADKVLALIDGIKALGIEIRQKKNLDRILKGGDE